MKEATATPAAFPLRWTCSATRWADTWPGGATKESVRLVRRQARRLELWDSPNRIQGDIWLSAATLGSLRWESKSFRRSSINDSNVANPASAPGSAHSVSPTARSMLRDDSVSSQPTGLRGESGRRSGGHARGCFTRDHFTAAGVSPYFGGLCSAVGMFLYQGEVGEELWQLFGDFPSDRSGSVLQFWRRHPAGNDVVGVHLRGSCFFVFFLAFRHRETQKSVKTNVQKNPTVDLYEGNVLWKPLLEIVQPLQRLS